MALLRQASPIAPRVLVVTPPKGMNSMLPLAPQPLLLPFTPPISTPVQNSGFSSSIPAPSSGGIVQSASSVSGPPIPSSDQVTVPSGSDPSQVQSNAPVSVLLAQGSIQPGSSQPTDGSAPLVSGGPVQFSTPVGSTQMSTPLAIGLGVGGGLLIGYLLGKVF